MLGLGTAAASLLAVIPLTILTRVFAILQKTPVTVFLLSGIFPLVPGAGIYYTAYYFIQGDNALALSNGISTFKVAVALAVGISLVLSIPLPPPVMTHTFFIMYNLLSSVSVQGIQSVKIALPLLVIHLHKLADRIIQLLHTIFPSCLSHTARSCRVSL